ncbi:MAG: hypothetical protein V4556_12795 [Bacteroidota bacterium]
MNKIERKLRDLNVDLYSKLEETKVVVDSLLKQYSVNFPTYTDHSLNHTTQVFRIVSDVLNDKEINNLNDKELYILGMASLLHDIGMCIPEDKISEIESDKRYTNYKAKNPDKSKEELIRDIHHELSYDFIKKESILLKIPNEIYADAIALVSKAHRKVELMDADTYKPKYFIENGRDEFACLPYLGAILRLSDELDITNVRTPDLLTKYYLPGNEISRLEWEKHMATFLVNMDSDKILISAKTNDQNVYHALEIQFSKIDEVLEYCQKVIRNIGNTGKNYSLELSKIDSNIITNILDKNIKFSIDVSNVIETLMGKTLYKNELSSVRELIQNSLDSCLYKKTIDPTYEPLIEVNLFPDKLECIDNGLGMDDYIVEKYFSKLSSSFYQKENLKNDYNPIGKFGIGVFSYFMIADYIDVETKKENTQELKFRVDKNPDNYFYFYNDYNKTSVGTKITLYFNSVFKEKPQKLILDYIQKTFQHIDVPVNINFEEENIPLRKRKYSESLTEFAQTNHIHKHFVPLFVDMKSFQSEFIDQNVEGIIQFCPTFKYHSLVDTEIIDEGFRDSGTRFEPIKIYNQGVFVRQIGGYMLTKTYGRINFKKGLPISLNRNEFDYLNPIITQLFEAEINLANQYLEQNLENDRLKSWELFLSQIMHYNIKHVSEIAKDTIVNDILYDFVKKNMIFNAIDNGNPIIIDYETFVKRDGAIIIKDIEQAKNISLKNNILIICPQIKLISIFRKTLVKSGYKIGLKLIDGKLFDFCFREDPNAIDISSFFMKERDEQYLKINLNNKKRLCEFVNVVKFKKNLYHSRVIINRSYPIIDFLLEIKENKEINKDKVSFAKIALSRIENVCSYGTESFFLIEPLAIEKIEELMNEIFDEVNNFFSQNFKFKASDLGPIFPQILKTKNFKGFILEDF